MSTDSSPSPDDVDKSKKNRSRKPDIQLYVPRAKRIENQVKQKITNFEKDANVVDAENLQDDSFFNLIDDDHNSMLVMMNNNDNSSQCGVNWKPNPSWFNSSSQDCSSYFPVRDNILNETTLNDAVYETDRANFSPKDGRIGKNLRSKYGRSSQDDDFSCVPTMTFQRQQTSSSTSSDKPFRKFSLPQPDPRKLPHQQVEAMLKMYNIKKDPVDDDSTKNSTAPIETADATDDCFVAPRSATSAAEATTNLNETIFRSNVPCSLNLPVDESNGQIVYDGRLSSTTTSPSTYWMTADVIDQLTGGGGDSGINEFFPSSNVKLTNPTMMLNKNEADSILDSLPTSYDEFESKDLTTKKNRSNQDLVGAGVVSSSTQCSSTSPLSSVPRTPVSLVSCGGGVESVERASSSSPSMIDPDDLEVQLINESFEEQMKQAQVLSNAKTKEAFYRQPNQESSSNLLAGVGAKTKSKSKHQIQKDFLDSSIHHQQQQNATNNQTSTTSSRCEGQIVGGVKQGLTWAGWGAGAAAGGGDNPSSLLTTPKHESSSGSTGSTTAVLTKKSSSGSIGSSSSSLEATNAVAVSSSASVSKLDYYEETDDDMDELSKAMIDKLLSCDDDDDANFKYGANKTVVQTSNAAAVDQAPTTASSSYKSSFDDECLQPSNSSAVSNKTWSTAPTSTTASVADSWEDILDSNCVPDFNSAVEQTSLDDLPKIDYLQFKPKDTSFDDKGNEFGHVLEAYDFPSSTKAETLHLAMQQLDCKHFNIQWVDETHALIICSDKFAANVVLDGSHPVIKVRPLSEASVQSKRKAKEFPVLRSYKPKPERTSFVARRLVESHLGKKTSTSTDQRLEERKKIERAKEQKKFIAQMREDVWEGRV